MLVDYESDDSSSPPHSPLPAAPDLHVRKRIRICIPEKIEDSSDEEEEVRRLQPPPPVPVRSYLAPNARTNTLTAPLEESAQSQDEGGVDVFEYDSAPGPAQSSLIPPPRAICARIVSAPDVAVEFIPQLYYDTLYESDEPAAALLEPSHSPSSSFHHFTVVRMISTFSIYFYFSTPSSIRFLFG